MKFFLADHQGKGYPYAVALEQAGWERVPNSGCVCDVALYDHDVGFSRKDGYVIRPSIVAQHERGTPIIMYPHAARPMVIWDGIYPCWPHTRMNVTIAQGHVDVMRSFGYDLPMEVCGWSMCEMRGWRPVIPCGRPVEVLFGPIHPNSNSFLHPVDKALNVATFSLLLRTPGIRLTVRHIKSLELNGIWREPGVRYVAANPNGSTAEIDHADVVIGHQTFAWIAAARGKPVIVFGEDVPPRSGGTMGHYTYAKSYQAYRELMRYPLEVEAARSSWAMVEMIEQAMCEDAGAAWRERFIGKPFDPTLFVQKVEEYL